MQEEKKKRVCFFLRKYMVEQKQRISQHNVLCECAIRSVNFERREEEIKPAAEEKSRVRCRVGEESNKVEALLQTKSRCRTRQLAEKRRVWTSGEAICWVSACRRRKRQQHSAGKALAVSVPLNQPHAISDSSVQLPVVWKGGSNRKGASASAHQWKQGPL